MLSIAFALVVASGPESFVLLQPGTVFLPPVGITTDAGTDHPSCCTPENKTIAARLIADAGEYVEIETLGAPGDAARHCAMTFEDDDNFSHELAAYRIRVRVERRAVLSVLRRAVKRGGLEVAAGVPVEVLDGGVRFGLFDTTREFTLPLDQVELGQAYVPSRWTPRAPKETRRQFRVLSGLTVGLGDGGTVTLLPGEQWPETAVRKSGAEAVISLEDRCSRLIVRVPRSALMEVDGGPDRYGSTHLCASAAALWARPGATVYWPDGTVAGTTRGDTFVQQPFGSEGRFCFDVTLQGVEGSLPLCFDTRDLSDEPFK